DGIDFAVLDAGGPDLRPVQELRAREDRHQPSANPLLEAARLASRAIELEQRHEVRLADGPPERAPRDVRQDLLGARRLLGLGARLAREDAPAALGLRAGPARVVRADDLHPEQARHVRHAFAGNHRMQLVVGFREAARDEGRPDLVIARRDGESELAETILDLADRLDLPLIDRAQILLAAELVLEDALAVDRHDHFMTVVEPALRIRAQLRAGLRRDVQIELVDAVDRKEMLDEEPAARAEGQPVHVARMVLEA